MVCRALREASCINSKVNFRKTYFTGFVSPWKLHKSHCIYIIISGIGFLGYLDHCINNSIILIITQGYKIGVTLPTRYERDK